MRRRSSEPPWSIPFEFPLYQWIVAVMAESFHTALEPTGRFVKEVFFGLSLVMVWELLSEFGLKKLYRPVFLAVVSRYSYFVFVLNDWINRKAGESRLRIREMGSRSFSVS